MKPKTGHSSMRSHTGIGTLVVILLASTSLYAARASRTADENRIEQGLESKHLLDLGDYTVSIADGRATLAGEVPTLNVKRKVEAEVRRLDPSLSVDNRLLVTPVAESDEDLAVAVGQAIRRDPFFDIFDWVSGSVDDAVVHLSGDVREPWHREDYEYRIAEIPGISQIVDDVAVLPLSPSDDEIRVAAARVIYQDSQFWKYAIQAHPPIHIIVNNGHVRLEGVVLNAMERQVVESLVRNDVLQLGVTNNLTTES
jgi:osmotically-inducible protein OsmY